MKVVVDPFLSIVFDWIKLVSISIFVLFSMPFKEHRFSFSSFSLFVLLFWLFEEIFFYWYFKYSGKNNVFIFVFDTSYKFIWDITFQGVSGQWILEFIWNSSDSDEKPVRFTTNRLNGFDCSIATKKKNNKQTHRHNRHHHHHQFSSIDLESISVCVKNVPMNSSSLKRSMKLLYFPQRLCWTICSNAHSIC